MPILSKKQWRFFASQHPDLLHKWQKESPVKYSELPEQNETDQQIYEDVILSDKQIQDIEDVLNIQGSDGNWDADDYMLGLFNGMELIRSIVDGDMEPAYRSLIDEAKKKTDVKVKVPAEKQDVIGLIDRKNMNDLLSDLELHSYFAVPENFDRFVKDINQFWSQKELAPTVNSLNEYLTNLNYGERTIAKSIDVLSMTDEERAAKSEKEKDVELGKEGVDKEIPTDKNFVKGNIKKVKEEIGPIDITKKLDSMLGTDITKDNALKIRDKMVKGLSDEMNVPIDKVRKVYNFHYELDESLKNIKENYKFGDRIRVANRESPFNQKKGTFIQYDDNGDSMVDMDSGELVTISDKYLILESISKINPTIKPKAIIKPITPTIRTDIGSRSSNQDNLPKEDSYEPSRNNGEGLYNEEKLHELKQLRKQVENTCDPQKIIDLFNIFEKKYLQEKGK